jgi:hypothetical protein
VDLIGAAEFSTRPCIGAGARRSGTLILVRRTSFGRSGYPIRNHADMMFLAFIFIDHIKSG